MGGNTVERHQLVRAEPQHFTERRLDVAPAVPHEGNEPRIEVALPPEHAGGEFVRETPVGVGQGSERTCQRVVERLTLAHRE